MDVKAPAAAAESKPDPKQQMEARKRREAIRGFEEMFVTEMFKAMRKTVPEGEETSQARKMWREQFDGEIAKRITEAGGIGLAPLLEKGLPAPANRSGR